jgi:hypothetical protein
VVLVQHSKIPLSDRWCKSRENKTCSENHDSSYRDRCIWYTVNHLDDKVFNESLKLIIMPQTVLYRDQDGKLQSTIVEALNGFHGANIPDTQVLRSAAGYYIGDLYEEKDINAWFPYSRDSACYWGAREEAEEALKTNDYPIKF